MTELEKWREWQTKNIPGYLTTAEEHRYWKIWQARAALESEGFKAWLEAWQEVCAMVEAAYKHNSRGEI